VPWYGNVEAGDICPGCSDSFSRLPETNCAEATRPARCAFNADGKYEMAPGVKGRSPRVMKRRALISLDAVDCFVSLLSVRWNWQGPVVSFGIILLVLIGCWPGALAPAEPAGIYQVTMYQPCSPEAGPALTLQHTLVFVRCPKHRHRLHAFYPGPGQPGFIPAAPSHQPTPHVATKVHHVAD